jgi:hypothetical protein
VENQLPVMMFRVFSHRAVVGGQCFTIRVNALQGQRYRSRTRASRTIGRD